MEQLVMSLKPTEDFWRAVRVLGVRYVADRGEFEILMESDFDGIDDAIDSAVRLKPDGPHVRFALRSIVSIVSDDHDAIAPAALAEVAGGDH